MSDAGSAMVVDGDEGQQQQAGGKDSDRLLVRDESYAIAERKGLPVEVQQAIAASGQSLPGLSLSRPLRRARAHG